MKKVFYISMLFIGMATLSGRAQTPIHLSSTTSDLCIQVDPVQIQMIKNAEAHLLMTYNDKNKPHLKPTRLCYEEPVSEFEEEMMKKEPKRAYGKLKDVENYNRALKVATKAEKEKDKAESVYLSAKQLEKNDAKKMDKAQKNLEKATMKYHMALKNLKRIRQELEKYR